MIVLPAENMIETIFPELAESNDEKIRKEILKYFQQFENKELRGVNISDWIDWLKKQGQKPTEWKQENREELTEFENAMMHIGRSFFEENARLDPNDTATIKEQAKLLLELAPKIEWSEEDEKKRNLLISILEVNHPNGCFKVNPANTLNMEVMSTKELVDWLKGRVQPQPKQKWSEEDEKWMKYLNEMLDYNFRNFTKFEPNAVDAYNWLKTIKQRMGG